MRKLRQTTTARTGEVRCCAKSAVAEPVRATHGATVNSRRSFFARMGAAIATIALAPELAFRAKLALPEVEKLDLESLCRQIYEIREARQRRNADMIEIWTSPKTPYEVEELRALGITYGCNQPHPINSWHLN